MNWMTITWPMVAGACLMLGLINLVIALRSSQRLPHLFFAFCAFAAVGFNALELALMRTTDLAQYEALLRWSVIPVSAIVASLVGFVGSFFGTDRKWLGLAAICLNTAAQIANFFSPVPVIRHVVAIRQVETFGGVWFTVPTTVNGPWNDVELLGVLALLAFVLDASITLWKRGGRRRAVIVGGSIIFFLIVGRGDALLIDKGIIQTPYLVSFAFVGVLIAMGYELSYDVLHAAALSLQVSRQREKIAHLGRVSMMGQLSSAIAHELDQPLGAILRNVETAALFLKSETPDLAELSSIISDIREGDERACSVINRLRALFKRRDIEPAPLVVGELFNDVIELTSLDAAARHATLDAKTMPGVSVVWADRVHIQQILLNLIGNAMDAMKDVPVAHRIVTLRAKPDNSGFVEFSVSDTGHGIPPEHLPEIFDPFFTTKKTGMGMGLAISRTIIEAHEGTIRAENNAGAGATFRFTLPVEMKRLVA